MVQQNLSTWVSVLILLFFFFHRYKKRRSCTLCQQCTQWKVAIYKWMLRQWQTDRQIEYKRIKERKKIKQTRKSRKKVHTLVHLLTANALLLSTDALIIIFDCLHFFFFIRRSSCLFLSLCLSLSPSLYVQRTLLLFVCELIILINLLREELQNETTLLLTHNIRWIFFCLNLLIMLLFSLRLLLVLLLLLP